MDFWGTFSYFLPNLLQLTGGMAYFLLRIIETRGECFQGVDVHVWLARGMLGRERIVPLMFQQINGTVWDIPPIVLAEVKQAYKRFLSAGGSLEGFECERLWQSWRDWRCCCRC